MAKAAQKEEPRPIIVKKIIEESHGGHHGGAWKVAYADFVTAMMAFFLLMWLLGATDEKQRKSIADYFSPTLVEVNRNGAGGDGLFGGDSIISEQRMPSKATQTGTLALTIPRDATGTMDDKGHDYRSTQQERFEQLKEELKERLKKDEETAKLLKNVRFTDTREGLRIDLVDESDFSMFALSTDNLVPRAQKLMREVAQVVKAVPNPVVVRGHTDSLPWASGKTMNNWMLSSARAETTRRSLVLGGVNPSRIDRIEGVADREPYNPEDKYDPRNRRMSITLKFIEAPRREAREEAKAPAESKAEKPVKPVKADKAH